MDKKEKFAEVGSDLTQFKHLRNSSWGLAHCNNFNTGLNNCVPFGIEVNFLLLT